MNQNFVKTVLAVSIAATSLLALSACESEENDRDQQSSDLSAVGVRFRLHIGIARCHRLDHSRCGKRGFIAAESAQASGADGHIAASPAQRDTACRTLCIEHDKTLLSTGSAMHAYCIIICCGGSKC